ncbi:DUF4932 domain-containing protein [Pedobacter cryoconitis]|uniref:Uncharacterized protein DUF4932 n=1 Tax=Pedobacter cryoconitis TaxID=188932 RepID=A0A327SM07_9SPHI|nr:DUF4932 domain-containing protein [Pedobacter cryoconitis]RAJ30316.1 uncharacterized protein DUF4932 [Pedobacter cryoconitis]
MKIACSILLFSVIVLFSSSPVFSQNRTTNEKFKECKVVLNGVNFTVDPRIELFHTIEVLQGIPLVNSIELDYKEKIAANFKPFKQHALFAYLDRNPMYEKLFGNKIEGPIWFMLHLTNDFDWRKDVSSPDEKNPQLDSLRILLKDFSMKSNYPKFFNSNSDLYNISLATLAYNLPDFDEKNRLLKYCGEQHGKNIQFNVILNFLGWGNFGPRIYKKDGKELYAVIAPEKIAIRIPTFDIAGLYRLLWHEFAHSFANPAVEKVENQLTPFSYLWEPVKVSMRAQAYSSWDAVVKEQLTEAITCRLAAQKFGEDAAELNNVRYQKGKDWIYLNSLLKALKYYEANRNAYPTLDSFMPKIIESFEEIKQTDIDAWVAESEQIRKPDVAAMPATGDIYDKENILFIVSSDEPDKEADQRLKKFMNEFKNRISSLKDASIVADTTALKMDLSAYNLSVWGTPKGNKFLQKYLPQIPLLIKDDKIIGENIYQGTGYGVLIGWVNPLNDKNIMVIHTAQNPDDLVDFNRIMNGGGNYHIFKNYITVKQGNFNRQSKVWLAK